MPTCENRKRMTLAEAKERLVPVEDSEKVQHIVANEHAAYSLLSHLVLTTCDFCFDGASGITEHVAKSDIHEEI